MLQIFNKKKFLVDYLDGFVDIHNHILPGIDDGAKKVENSIELIKEFSEFGCKRFIATPHIMHNYYQNDMDTITKSHLLLTNALIKKGLQDINIEASAEHMIDSNFELLLENDKVMPLAKNYLLIEMSYLQASINFDIAIQKIASRRLFPILAHPERYVFLHNRLGKYRKYKEEGILFQLNFLSLTDFYGKEVRKTAFKLIEENLIDFIASDAHNLTHIEELKSIKLSNNHLGLLLPIIENTIHNFY